MKNNDEKIIIANELSLLAASQGLLSFNDFNSLFDGYPAREWLHLVEWAHPTPIEKILPKTNSLHDDPQADAQPDSANFKQGNSAVLTTSKTISLRALLTKKGRRSLLPLRFIRR